MTRLQQNRFSVTLFFLFGVWTILLLLHSPLPGFEQWGSHNLVEYPELGHCDDLGSSTSHSREGTHAPPPTSGEGHAPPSGDSRTPPQTGPQLAQSLPKECGYCSDPKSKCAKFGETNLARSRAYEGSNARLRRVLAKARRGEPVTIGVLGGSVSAGHGILPHQSWVTQVFDWWNTTFPHPDNVFVNGAVPAVSSEYYSSCYGEYIPKDVDLVFVELAVNESRDEWMAQTYEWLMRNLLTLPKNPAVIHVQSVTLYFDTISFGGDTQIAASQYYDVPSISLRNVLLPFVLQNKKLEREYFHIDDEGQVDFRHIGYRGHRMMSDLVAVYMERQICEVAMADAGRTAAVDDDEDDDVELFLPSVTPVAETIPRIRMFEKYVQDKQIPVIHPQCWSIRSVNHPLSPTENVGWVDWSWKDKSYLVAREPGARLTFEINLEPEALGFVGLSHLRSKSFGLGDLACWLDDDISNQTVLEGWWDFGANLLRAGTVVRAASPGKHLLHCEILQSTHDPSGGHEFRIVALTTL